LKPIEQASDVPCRLQWSKPKYEQGLLVIFGILWLGEHLVACVDPYVC
jgi:hypothetical protein